MAYSSSIHICHNQLVFLLWENFPIPAFMISFCALLPSTELSPSTGVNSSLFAFWKQYGLHSRGVLFVNFLNEIYGLKNRFFWFVKLICIVYHPRYSPFIILEFPYALNHSIHYLKGSSACLSPKCLQNPTEQISQIFSLRPDVKIFIFNKYLKTKNEQENEWVWHLMQQTDLADSHTRTPSLPFSSHGKSPTLTQWGPEDIFLVSCWKCRLWQTLLLSTSS